MAYKLRSRVLSAISNVFRPVESVIGKGKAIVGATRYRFKMLGSLIAADSPKYDFSKIRQVYRRFGFIRQALAVYKHRATSDHPDILCDNPKARDALMGRLNDMRVYEELPSMFQDLVSFGNVFYEIIFDEEEITPVGTGYRNYGYVDNLPNNNPAPNGFEIDIPKEKDVREKARKLKRITGVKRLEPDFIKVVRDEFARVKYYVNFRDALHPPILLEHWRILHIKLDTLPGDAFGIGLIEGAIDDIAALRMVEDLQLQLIKHDIYPFRVFTCPTNEVIQEVESKLGEQERFGDLVVPDGVTMKQSTVGNASQDLRALMIFYKEKIFMDLGVPMQMLIEGSKTNKATAVVQSDAFNQNVYAFINAVYIPMERFCKLVLLFEGIDSDVVWNYKDIDRGSEQTLRSEVVQWFKEGLIDREDGISLLESLGGFRYLNEKSRSKLMRKAKITNDPAIAAPPQTVGLPPADGSNGDGTTPQLGDRIAEVPGVDKPKRITDRIKERVTKPDGTRVEKTTERIRQTIEFAEILRDSILKCDRNVLSISEEIAKKTSDFVSVDSLNGEMDEFCKDVDACISIYAEDKNSDAFEYLISKSCAEFGKKLLGHD